ncbi:helix-turn-helix transcriptional regulator [Rathayibacter sp. VKM Ac-2835]|uniref:helix-turn-helix transcriptional regulator n=1 Tax=Rathayibacter sp. VKM Ac-2835 TaxID=2739043 RepID=UPI0015630D52|nr:helix-turn-helix transcriptional regulator [Rathayibacter sp. VKM Ac-2835]NRG40374.1 helix-turn-helix transcriptional regulator [Rathayibacter sp. VKM Ac-2835]
MTNTEVIAEARAHATLPPPPLARAIREAAGLSQARMAVALDVTPITICRWEGGTRTPRRQHLVAYAALLRELQRIEPEQAR